MGFRHRESAHKASSAGRGQAGAASVEHVGLVVLVALIAIAGISVVMARGRIDAGRDVARAIGRKITCAPRLPDACHHHPLVPAYGWPIARVVRALAPVAAARTGPSGIGVVPVDFRRCRQESCAIPDGADRGGGLTTSGRRTTAFTEVVDSRREGGRVEITYWFYRPTIGWEAIRRSAGQAELAAAAHTRVLISDDPALVPLETLPGRNHYTFPANEVPPWQWRIRGIHDGWSS